MEAPGVRPRGSVDEIRDAILTDHQRATRRIPRRATWLSSARGHSNIGSTYGDHTGHTVNGRPRVTEQEATQCHIASRPGRCRSPWCVVRWHRRNPESDTTDTVQWSAVSRRQHDVTDGCRRARDNLFCPSVTPFTVQIGIVVQPNGAVGVIVTAIRVNSPIRTGAGMPQVTLPAPVRAFARQPIREATRVASSAH